MTPGSQSRSSGNLESPRNLLELSPHFGYSYGLWVGIIVPQNMCRTSRPIRFVAGSRVGCCLGQYRHHRTAVPASGVEPPCTQKSAFIPVGIVTAVSRALTTTPCVRFGVYHRSVCETASGPLMPVAPTGRPSGLLVSRALSRGPKAMETTAKKKRLVM